MGLTLALLLVLYLLTLYPGVGGRFGAGDAIRFQYVGRILGVAHEPGYPQYVLLSFAWSYLPLPLSLATKINLMSAAVSLVGATCFFTVARWLSGSAMAAALSTWFVYLSRDIWTMSTQAEVYALNLAWVAAVIWAAHMWARRLDRKWLVALLFVYALSFGNHLTMITLLPAMLFLVLVYDRNVLLDARMILAGASAIAVGLAQYGFLLWRSYNPRPPLLVRFPRQATFAELFEYTRGTRFTKNLFLKSGVAGIFPRLGEAGVHGAFQLSVAFSAMGLWGIYLLSKRKPRFAGFLTLAAAGELLFAVAYEIQDRLYYCAPVWLVLGLFAAVAIGRLSVYSSGIRAIVLAVLLASLAWTTADNYSQLRGVETRFDYAALIEEAPPGSYIVVNARTRRQAKVLGNYYKYGLNLEKARRLRFVAGDQIFDDRPRFLEDRPIYFQNPGVLRYLERNHVDYIEKHSDDDPDRYYFVTGTTTPISAVEFNPAGANSIAMDLGGEPRALCAASGGASRVHRRPGTATKRASGRFLWIPRRTGSDRPTECYGTSVEEIGSSCSPRSSASTTGRSLPVSWRKTGIDLPLDPERAAHLVVAWRNGDPASASVVSGLTEPVSLPLPE